MESQDDRAMRRALVARSRPLGVQVVGERARVAACDMVMLGGMNEQ